MYSLYVALPICTAKAQGRAVGTTGSPESTAPAAARAPAIARQDLLVFRAELAREARRMPVSHAEYCAAHGALHELEDVRRLAEDDRQQLSYDALLCIFSKKQQDLVKRTAGRHRQSAARHAPSAATYAACAVPTSVPRVCAWRSRCLRRAPCASACARCTLCDS